MRQWNCYPMYTIIHYRFSCSNLSTKDIFILINPAGRKKIPGERITSFKSASLKITLHICHCLSKAIPYENVDFNVYDNVGDNWKTKTFFGILYWVWQVAIIADKVWCSSHLKFEFIISFFNSTLNCNRKLFIV